jgi:hypothetical protein
VRPNLFACFLIEGSDVLLFLIVVQDNDEVSGQYR